LGGKQSVLPVVEVDYQNVVGQDELTRFDKKKGKPAHKNNRGHDKKNHHNRGNEKKHSDTNR
jgi:hypothetical protein